MNRFQYLCGLLIAGFSFTFCAMEAHTPLKQFLEKHARVVFYLQKYPIDDPRCRACLTGAYYQTKINALQTSIQTDNRGCKSSRDNRTRIKNGFVSSYTGMIREAEKACACALNAD